MALGGAAGSSLYRTCIYFVTIIDECILLSIKRHILFTTAHGEVESIPDRTVYLRWGSEEEICVNSTTLVRRC